MGVALKTRTESIVKDPHLRGKLASVQESRPADFGLPLSALPTGALEVSVRSRADASTDFSAPVGYHPDEH